jgi:hypothetical protein
MVMLFCCFLACVCVCFVDNVVGLREKRILGHWLWVQLTNLNLNEGFSPKKIPQEENVANTLPPSLIKKIMEVVVVGIMLLLRKKNYY